MVIRSSSSSAVGVDGFTFGSYAHALSQKLISSYAGEAVALEEEEEEGSSPVLAFVAAPLLPASMSLLGGIGDEALLLVVTELGCMVSLFIAATEVTEVTEGGIFSSAFSFSFSDERGVNFKFDRILPPTLKVQLTHD